LHNAPEGIGKLAFTCGFQHMEVQATRKQRATSAWLRELTAADLPSCRFRFTAKALRIRHRPTDVP
jgi:hypothetical protein